MSVQLFDSMNTSNKHFYQLRPAYKPEGKSIKENKKSSNDDNEQRHVVHGRNKPHTQHPIQETLPSQKFSLIFPIDPKMFSQFLEHPMPALPAFGWG